MKAGDLAAFPSGTGISHTVLNDGDREALLLVGGEADKVENRIVYPVNPSRRTDLPPSRWWTDAPRRPLGSHETERSRASAEERHEHHSSRTSVTACATCATGPASPLVAILTLSLGIGLNAAVFTVVDVALLRNVPYAEPERLVHLWQVQDNAERRRFRSPGRPCGSSRPRRTSSARSPATPPRTHRLDRSARDPRSCRRCSSRRTSSTSSASALPSAAASSPARTRPAARARSSSPTPSGGRGWAPIHGSSARL